jgi:hypothetical protein
MSLIVIAATAFASYALLPVERKANVGRQYRESTTADAASASQGNIHPRSGWNDDPA